MCKVIFLNISLAFSFFTGEPQFVAEAPTQVLD